MSDQPLRIVGVPGSPYSRKLRAVLRYRRIPHRLDQPGLARDARAATAARAAAATAHPPRARRRSEARTDSTPLIRELETRYRGRSVIPPDGALAFIDALLEDYADEWLTKAMFHYRWAFAPDIAKAAAILPRWSRTNQPERDAVANGKMFAERQVGRLAVVGSSEITAPVIEDELSPPAAACSTPIWPSSRFVLGGRPAASDFGLYGQLTQLVGFDPTPAAIAHKARAARDGVGRGGGGPFRSGAGGARLASPRRRARHAARAAGGDRPRLCSVPARQRRRPRTRARSGSSAPSTAGRGHNAHSPIRASACAGCARDIAALGGDDRAAVDAPARGHGLRASLRLTTNDAA